jgi:DNA-binding LacI/PurR family transcriptional regulator
MATTIYDIADAAGVSSTAVSAVLGGRGKQARIGQATAERILALAHRLGYERNDLAHAVVSGRTRLIAIITRDPTHEYIGRLIHGALAAATQRNYLLHLQSAPDEANVDLARAFAQCRAYRPVGVFLNSLDWMVDGAGPDAAGPMGGRIPIINSHCQRGVPGIAIDSDDALGTAQAVAHLRGLGHRRIAFLGGPRGQRSSDERRAAFRAAMAAAGIPVPTAYDTGSGWAWEPAATATQRLLARASRPTAIVCANDCLAVVAMQIARDRGLEVPRDLSLVGFSDEIVGQFVRPRPTTVIQPFHEIGHAAVSAIIDVAEGRLRIGDLAERRLPTTLAIRGTSAPPRA